MGLRHEKSHDRVMMIIMIVLIACAMVILISMIFAANLAALWGGSLLTVEIDADTAVWVDRELEIMAR